MASSTPADGAPNSPLTKMIIGLPKTLTFMIVGALIAYTIWLRKGKATSLPDLPWVARSEKAWIFGNFRTRWWCSMNYEEALRRAYDQVRSRLFLNQTGSPARAYGKHYT